VVPLLLGSSGGTSSHSFKTFGFPAAKPAEGMWGYGTLGDLTTEVGYLVLQLTGATEVTPGFSGAPVLDTITRRVVGMVTAITIPDQYGRLAETAFITPTEILQDVCSVLRISDVCPYRSLDAFTEDDAEFFFGRERVVQWLVESLRQEPRFLAVLGPSGSGKSSLVQAGLIPQLRQSAVPGSDRWGVIVVRPADQPFNQLEAEGLPDASGGLVKAVQAWPDQYPEQTRLVLAIDQFEELLVTCPQSLRQVFVTQLTELLEAALPVTVVLTMRDDFYSRFAQDAPALLPWLERGLVNVPPTLEHDELQAIVEEPAQAVGLVFETGLVDAILEDVLGSVPGRAGQVGRSTVLPLLEFALTQLWERRQDGMLTHEAYESIGRVTGGLTQWADRTYYGLAKEEQRLARRVLTDLVHLGDESQGLPDSPQRRPLDVLSWDEDEWEVVHGVVRQLADARLLTTGRDPQSGQETAELIHDAVLREWSLLRGWLREDRQLLAWRHEIGRRVRKWVESSPDDSARRDEGWLLRGRELREAGQWLAEHGERLQVHERAYVHESVALREFERWRSSLRGAMMSWYSDRRVSIPLRGASLEAARHWLDKCPDKLSDDEKRYVQHSMRVANWWVPVTVGFALIMFISCIVIVLTVLSNSQ
jgi:energy-coupling factor transporter ATP-binding protein EcfA2